MRLAFITFLFFQLLGLNVFASSLLIPMDDSQKNHLKAYGIAYWTLQNEVEVQWLLNYRGGSFLIQNLSDIQNECVIRGVSFEIIADVQATQIMNEIAQADVNMDIAKLEKAPKIAVYTPKNKQPWDDAVTLALTYAEIPYDLIYDPDIIEGKLSNYDWLHLHHEDFTGQYGKFYSMYKSAAWYKEQQYETEAMAKSFGFNKVSKLKLFIVKSIKEFVLNGGFLFAMCSATDSYDIALSSENTDVCEHMFDGDAADAHMQEKLDYSQTFAFKDYTLSKNPLEYEFSNIDVSTSRKVNKDEDYFTLFEFSAKWDPIPTMLCQNHTNMIKGFMGQTTAYNKNFVKSNVLVMGENKSANEARYIHGEFGKGTWTFFGGHDPEDYQHYVYDPPTELDLHPNSPGYRLILNNVLFPAAKKKKQKT
ncbi:MAG: asparagine synthetase B [Bacteroidetes bacterium GWF2_33_38]|nr:MAG: asparagine synthetase B [Bacteroidetes bacterium GWF2_33_38]OFY91032.1 MAG: asparagine synthetase B [Bacteroidetes bacterium RIFOXYA2_FULL_33_7]